MSKQIYLITGTVALTLLVVGLIAGLFYYQHLRSSPEYSLALLIDAAKRDDTDEVDTIVDVDAVVEDFMPQITSKAVELYGRGMSPEAIQRATVIARPLMPAVKDRARAELPRVIRERTARYDVPFFAMVMGANKYLDVSVSDDMALVNSKLQDHPLEMRMRRNGDRWQVIGVKDDKLAMSIAQKIGQEIIAVAAFGGNKDTADKFGGIGNLSNMLRQAQELVK